jgi:hypothetical protein
VPSVNPEPMLKGGLARVVLVIVPLLLFSSSCFPYRYHNSACKQRGAALSARLDNLRHDADEQLTIGTKKDALIRFCETHGLSLTLTANQAMGDFSAKGCAPSGCGTDDFMGGLRVAVDKDGTVTGKPSVGGIYSNCF